MPISTPGGQQLKMSILSTNVDQKSLETEFSIAICSPNGYKWQSKPLFLAIYDPSLSTVKSIFDCRLPDVISVCDSFFLQNGNYVHGPRSSHESLTVACEQH